MFDSDRSVTPPGPGVWALSGDGLVLREAAAAGAAVVLVPTEQVTLLVVDLPLPTRAQRLAALPFAVEDQLAEPLEAVHVALGVELSPRRHLAGVVRREVMAAWLARLAAAGHHRCIVTPDALALPAPTLGGWSVEFGDGRVLVRTDETAFAVSIAQFRDLWLGQGQPPLTAHGDGRAPAEFDADAIPGAGGELLGRLSPPALDLRQGPFAAPRAALSPALRRLAAVLGVAVFAHVMIAGIDTAHLQSIARERRAEAAALLTAAAPGAVVDDETISRLGRLADSADERGGFLPLLVRASRAIATVGGSVQLQSLTYADSDASLALQVEAGDLAELQEVEAALADAGLRPDSGAAGSDGGRAEGQITVRGRSEGDGR